MTHMHLEKMHILIHVNVPKHFQSLLYIYDKMYMYDLVNSLNNKVRKIE